MRPAARGCSVRNAFPISLLFWAACVPEVEGVPGDPKCDGRLQTAEGTLDAPFDRDNDGYVDGRNVDCVAAYGAWVLDCDDTDPRMHPEAPEIACNDIDDDCNPDTPDALDHDSDGVIACQDCDDADPARAPDNQDVCWDGIDNDCDGVTDNGCGLDYNGYFQLDQRVAQTCALDIVQIDFNTVSVLWSPPYASFVSVDSAMPGLLNGGIDDSGTFVIEGETPVATGTCTGYFRWSGEFDSRDSFSATFDTQYSGVFCNGCTDKTWSVVGTRIGY
jgi:hypothetical protein